MKNDQINSVGNYSISSQNSHVEPFEIGRYFTIEINNIMSNVQAKINSYENVNYLNVDWLDGTYSDGYFFYDFFYFCT